MKILEKAIVRRMVIRDTANDFEVSIARASLLLRRVEAQETSVLVAASGFSADAFADGLFSERFAYAACVAAGVVTVGAIGDGTFLEWLFSEEGLEALIAFAKTIMEIVAILAPLFL